MSDDWETEMKDLGLLDDPTDGKEYSKADYEKINFAFKSMPKNNDDKMIKEFSVSRSYITLLLQQIHQRNILYHRKLEETDEILEHLIGIIGEKK
jgi:hypothetical protein